eukprot:3246548-Pyramimonas_sp.AAC.1
MRCPVAYHLSSLSLSHYPASIIVPAGKISSAMLHAHCVAANKVPDISVRMLRLVRPLALPKCEPWVSSV